MFDWSTANLPNPSIDLRGQIEPSVIRTEMESGRQRQRQRFTSGLRTMNIQWLFTDPEFALFQGIIQHELSGGADWFDNLTIAIGEGLETITARIVGGAFSYSYVPVLQWRVTAAVETLNVSPLTAGEVDAILNP